MHTLPLQLVTVSLSNHDMSHFSFSLIFYLTPIWFTSVKIIHPGEDGKLYALSKGAFKNNYVERLFPGGYNIWWRYNVFLYEVLGFNAFL